MIVKDRTQRWQFFIFILMWTAYGATVMLRRPLGLVKADMEAELSLTKYELGLLDTAFLLPYAGVQTLLGSVGDHHGVRKTISACLLASAMSMVMFSNWQDIQVFLLLLFFNGASQSLVWPTSTKAIGEWFTSSQRNTVFGFYGTSSFAGGIVGTLLAVKLREIYGWQNVYQIPSIIVVCLSAFVFISFRKPSEVDIRIMDQDITEKTHSKVQLSFKETWNIPTAEAGVLATSFELGGVVGSVTIGFIIDRLLRGQCLLGCSIYILLSSASLFIFHMTSMWGRTFNVICIFSTGLFNCGVDTIMTGSVPTELGNTNGRNAGAAISGIVNGFGKISTILQGPVIGVLAELYGWPGVLMFLTLLSIIGSIVTFNASRKMETSK